MGVREPVSFFPLPVLLFDFVSFLVQNAFTETTYYYVAICTPKPYMVPISASCPWHSEA